MKVMLVIFYTFASRRCVQKCGACIWKGRATARWHLRASAGTLDCPDPAAASPLHSLKTTFKPCDCGFQPPTQSQLQAHLSYSKSPVQQRLPLLQLLQRGLVQGTLCTCLHS